MTDTTKPTGETIDDELAKLVDAVRRSCISMSSARRDWYTDEAIRLERLVNTRLAERPNRAVARGDDLARAMCNAYWSVDAPDGMFTGPMYSWDNMLSYEKELWAKRADAVLATLTTPTETTAAEPKETSDAAE